MPSVELPMELPLHVSSQQCYDYERLALSVVERNASDFEDHLERTSHHLAVDKRKWKLLKSREKIDIFRSREVFHPDIFAHTTSEPSKLVHLAKLLCVGTLVGSLDDAMLGSATATHLSMAARSLYIQDEFIQHAVLHDIHKPTADTPFQSVGLKWAFRSSRVATIVQPRDLVYVEATGFHQLQRPDGSHERIGYVVNHSVDRPDVPPLKDAHGVTRAKLSLCIFFRQAAPGVVQVYASVTSDPGGQLPPKLSAQSAASALVAVSRAMDCAFDRTLVWLLKKRLDDASHHHHHQSNKSPKGKWACGQCTRELASYRTRTLCTICHTPVCSRCTKTRKLALGATPAELSLVPMQVCTGCLTHARRLGNAAQVVLDESLDPHRERPSSVWMSNVANRHTPAVTPQSARAYASFETLGKYESKSVTQCPARDTADTVATEDDTIELEFEFGFETEAETEMETEIDWMDDGTSHYGSQTSSPHSWTSSTHLQSPLERERQRMLMTMSRLRLQAEETYSATMSLSTSARFELVLD